ncbi:hypothetical protein LX15_001896 [Streptoalloteichus tenebrarius]|uniref:Transposase IS4-like domain-containing protein n=1 Tax=Streptoalloteichus tenebrarius (strain ATCC 17920 / DSM 40477 / JCM 4838 / CBS 697.72 / NBRC 16177 / NCIMB 11028 / NRRL B-12390 / A12253. 1 / ISP 5477) TaxID=1933 RepID=A0ABT1HRU0_STRSD|nr:hypothetical protein [Streptoalloteichus tenebrarius]BFF04570.1 hypothetical protein GCM10020241_62450 [Streptoalloteichus tenebrarius]
MITAIPTADGTWERILDEVFIKDGSVGAVEGTITVDSPRGRLTSKIHFAVDGHGLPMSIPLAPGQAGDNPPLLPLLDAIAVERERRGRIVVERCFNRLR